MDADAKKTALRMIPYGLYVLTAEKDGEIAAATVNWVTQTAFDPPLVVVGVKADASAHDVIKKAGSFALNILGKGQQGPAFAFFKPVEKDGNTINGEAYSTGSTGAPVLESVPAYVECSLEQNRRERRPFHFYWKSGECGCPEATRRTRGPGDAAHGRPGRQGLLRRLKNPALG